VTNAANIPDCTITVMGNFDHTTTVVRNPCFNHFDSKHFVDYITVVDRNSLADYYDRSYYYNPCFSWCSFAGLVYQHILNYR